MLVMVMTIPKITPAMGQTIQVCPQSFVTKLHVRKIAVVKIQ